MQLPLTLLALLSTAQSLAIESRATTPVWMTLPATPDLPSPISTTTTPINGVNLWMQKYNEKAGGIPLVMDHGGLGYSAYFGAVISRLVKNGHYVIALDRRGHGRSTFNAGDVFTFDMFAQDTYALLKGAGVTSYNVVGWSDGGITTLASLLNSTIAGTINKAYLFGASAVPGDTNSTFGNTAIFTEFVTRCAKVYATLQPKANFTLFGSKVSTMEATLPQFTDAQLGKIDKGAKIWIAAGQYDEAVNHDVPARLNKAIKGSKLVTLTNVSHFAPLQDPDQFTKSVESFLAA